tara:strand:- start:80 stop:1450 length:1371 start_codon:yes stop_codon:yes gene_type:complete
MEKREQIVAGFSHGFHNAAWAKVQGDRILFAQETERVSRKKFDAELGFIPLTIDADVHVFYENIYKKNDRRISFSQPPAQTKYLHQYSYMRKHHESHAASAYYTAPFSEDVVCVVIDAIGEWDTCSIWRVNDGILEKVWSKKYPFSLGLFYSAITKRVGLQPNCDEYITMGMAAYGEPCVDMLWCFNDDVNLHKGFTLEAFKGETPEDIAASAQMHLETEIIKIMAIASTYGKNLCYAGGVALNCVANSKFAHMFDRVWIFPNPGDAGASLGCALAHNKRQVEFKDTFLGTMIDRRLNPREVVDHLLKHKVVGVANGRAEFGPRALGNRSLLGDPRYNIKNTVNKIKRRQKFRPFAPAILAEYYDEYFEGFANEYMQFVSWAKHDYKSVTHVDGSSRVQLVYPNDDCRLRLILEEFFSRTGVPMLLNTSLNIKGEPMVDTWEHALEFEKKYGVRVF